MKNKSIDNYFELARQTSLTLSYDKIQALVDNHVILTAPKKTWWSTKNLIIMTTTLVIATVSLLVNWSPVHKTEKQVQQFNQQPIEEMTTVTDSMENNDKESVRDKSVVSKRQTIVSYDKVGEDSVRKEVSTEEEVDFRIEEEIVSPINTVEQDIDTLVEQKTEEEKVSKTLNTVEFIITNKTTEEDLELLKKKCKEHNVRFNFENLHFKDGNLYKFKLTLRAKNNTLEAKHNHKKDKDYEWKFGWVLNKKNKIERFYTGNPERNMCSHLHSKCANSKCAK